MARAFLFLTLLCGCPSPDPAKGIQSTPDSLDYNFFVCNVQPVLTRRCSYLACHGNAQHALRVYSPGKLRLTDDGTRNGRDVVLTGDEVNLNFQSASGLVITASPQARAAPDLQQVLLLGKPLARREGGAEHHGVAIFPVFPAKHIGDDPEFISLVAWVQGAQQTKPLDSDCQSVFDTLGIQPR